MDYRSQNEQKKDPACCYQMPTKPKEQQSIKPARFIILEVLRHIKATCNCHT